MGLFGLIIIVIVGLYLLGSIKILSEYERGVIFRLGRLLNEAKGPGVILVFGPVDRIVRVDLRQQALEVPPQDVITRDNVTLKVNAVIYWRVVDARLADGSREIGVAEVSDAQAHDVVDLHYGQVGFRIVTDHAGRHLLPIVEDHRQFALAGILSRAGDHVVAHQVGDAVGLVAGERHHRVDVIPKVDEESVGRRALDEFDHVRPVGSA